MKNLNLKFIPFSLLCIYVAKCLISGAGINEVLLIGMLASLTAFYESSMNNKKVDQLQKQINVLNEQNKVQDKAIDDLKSSIVSVKVSSGIRGLTK